ncbi:MAG: cadherin repeat domain-containing protein, partial [Candidatus Atribacteria bacterium]|nr:cadherin repeat domain-containing protein [Candidatus Atribacteria bacterium]
SVTGSDPDGILGTLSYTLISVSPEPTNDFTVDPTSGEISWDPTCDDIIDRVDTTYTITVEVSDGCDTDQGSFDVTLNAEPCLCALSLQVKEGGSLVEYLDSLSSTDYADLINPLVGYSITVGTNASRLWFRICASPDAEMVYNFYRGGSCPNKWDFDDLSANTPPGWSPVLDAKFNSQYYPDGYPDPSPDDLQVCNTGDPVEPVNILMVKVTEGLTETIYRINVYR